MSTLNLLKDKGDVIMNKQSTIQYRGITAEINCNQCFVMDRHGNTIGWSIHTDDMNEVVKQLDNAIRYLRGFITLAEFENLVA